MEYLDDCITTMRYVVRKVGFNCWQEIYHGDMFSRWVDLAYDILYSIDITLFLFCSYYLHMILRYIIFVEIV